MIDIFVLFQKRTSGIQIPLSQWGFEIMERGGSRETCAMASVMIVESSVCLLTSACHRLYNNRDPLLTRINWDYNMDK